MFVIFWLRCVLSTVFFFSVIMCMIVVCAVAGLGFGIISGAFSMINILSDTLGPGTVGLNGDSQYYFITSGYHHMHSASCNADVICAIGKGDHTNLYHTII